ncbi:MAG: EthD family reductase [Dehalococcoidia bacterium]
MIRVSILYPNGGKFDQDYYINNHMKMVAEKAGPAMIRFEVDKGVAGAAPGSPAPYMAVGHMYFNSVPEFVQAFAPHAAEFMADTPNYTDARPEVQISEIVSG